jgi:hypothetical protein
MMDSVPDIPDPQTRTAVTQRIIAHVTRSWPGLGEPIVRHRGRFCYVSAVLPGRRELTPILRLRYQGPAGRWAVGIYLASSGQYTESELPASFGPKTGTPKKGSMTPCPLRGPQIWPLTALSLHLKTRPRPRKRGARALLTVRRTSLPAARPVRPQPRTRSRRRTWCPAIAPRR